MISLSSAARHAIEKALIRFGKDAYYVIYPFGQDGKILKGILNYEYHIQEKAIIDNYLSEQIEEVEDISFLKKHRDAVVLISSSGIDHFDEIRRMLTGIIDDRQCVEVYEEIMIGDNGYNYYSDMLRLTQIYDMDYKFTRVGNTNDGGYVMVDDLPGGIAYSFGISDDPSWDVDMYRRGYEVFMYDHMVECPQVAKECHSKMHFFKKGIADSVQTNDLGTLNEFLIENRHIKEENLILKMDVEGAEWGFLEMVSSETLNKFRQIVFEFHGMNTKSTEQREKIINGLKKLFITHRVVHIHANNYGGYFSYNNHVLPETLEVTYLHKILTKSKKKNVSLPLNIDAPNRIGNKDIILGNWNEEFYENSYNFFKKCFDKYYRCPENDVIFVLGDSHVGFFSGNDGDNYFREGGGIGICRPGLETFRVFHLGPALAYHLNKYGSSTRGREKIEYIFDKLIPKGSNLLLSFGEIDIRVHVMKRAVDNAHDYCGVVDTIVDNYFSFIKDICNDYKVYVWGPVASQNDIAPIDKCFPRCGTQLERNKATEYFTRKMKEICSEKNNVEFISAFSLLIDDQMRTKEEFYKDPVHLSQHAWKIVESLFVDRGINCSKRL